MPEFTNRQPYGKIAVLGFVALFTSCKSSEPEESPPNPVAANSAPLIALTPTEYNNSIRDLLGLPNNGNEWPAPPAAAARISPTEGMRAGLFGSQAAETPPWPWSFPKELGVDHFEGMADGQVASAYQLEEVQKAANHFAAYTLVSPLFFVCTDWNNLDGEAKKNCGWQSVERFAQRAWRRPIKEDERERLKNFWTSNWNAGDAEEAIALTVSGVLQSPAFLFRVEFGQQQQQAGNALPLSDWEMANRLSYFLWDSIPDVTLFAAAARGELSTKEQIRAQATRLLNDDRARKTVVRFHEQWLEADQIRGMSPARRVFGPVFGISPEPPLDTTGDGVWPAILGPIRYSLEAELRYFIENIVFDGPGTLTALLTDNSGFMSSSTEPLYGPNAKRVSDETITVPIDLIIFSQGAKQTLNLYPATFPANERSGVLTHPGILAMGAYTVHPAPIIRGKHLLERIACQYFGLPPPGAEAEIPPDTESVAATNRVRTEEATKPPSCNSCHQHLNPPGFAFEHYDAMGKLRAEDNGQPVDASGNFNLWSGETFEFQNAVELTAQLARSTQVRDCYSLRWTRYATGIYLDDKHPEVQRLQASFRENDQIKDLLIAITTSDLFRYRNSGGSQ